MAVPPYVATLEDYWRWLDRLIEESGGFLDGHALIVEPIVDEDEEIVAVRVPTQRIRFYGTFLSMAMTISDDLVSTRYSFHCQHDDRTPIWRKDNVHRHQGHADRPHIHLPDKVPQPYLSADGLKQVRDGIWWGRAVDESEP